MSYGVERHRDVPKKQAAPRALFDAEGQESVELGGEDGVCGVRFAEADVEADGAGGARGGAEVDIGVAGGDERHGGLKLVTDAARCELGLVAQRGIDGAQRGDGLVQHDVGARRGPGCGIDHSEAGGLEVALNHRLAAAKRGLLAVLKQGAGIQIDGHHPRRDLWVGRRQA